MGQAAPCEAPPERCVPGQVRVPAAFPHAPGSSSAAADSGFPKLLTHPDGNVLPKSVEFDKNC